MLLKCDNVTLFPRNLVLVMVMAMPSPQAHDGKWTGQFETLHLLALRLFYISVCFFTLHSLV